MGESEGGSDLETPNAVFRRHASGLCSTGSSHVVDLLTAAMDFHCQNGAFDPGSNDGKAQRETWETVFAKDLPSNDPVAVESIPGTRDDGRCI